MTDNRYRVVVTQRFFDDETIAYLDEHGCNVVLPELPPGEADRNVPEATLIEWLNGADGWIVGHAKVSREVLSARPELRAIARRGVGYDRVNLDAVRDLGRTAAIAAGANNISVAEQTIGFMLALGRRFNECQANVAAGNLSIPLGADLYRKTVGIVGLGRIGQSVLDRLRGFDVRLLVHTHHPDPNGGYEAVDLSTLLSESDYVTLHAPLTDETRFLIRAETIEQMKPTAFVINTGRGGLVEDRDLLVAIREGRLAGAGLDVFMSESDPDYAEVTQALANLPNVIVAPHAGASTAESLRRTKHGGRALCGRCA